MKKTCQLAAVQVYLVLQYEFLLPLNLQQPHQKGCVSKVLRQLLAAQQAPKSQRGALAIWFLRERPKKFQKNKKNIQFGLLFASGISEGEYSENVGQKKKGMNIDSKKKKKTEEEKTRLRRRGWSCKRLPVKNPDIQQYRSH